jgi:hypothetical protein
MQSSVLETIDDPSLWVYVVWVPILPGDNHGAAVESSAIVSDRRTTHFWDEQRLLPLLFARVLGLPEGWPAWDVYLAYEARAYWGEAPPAPAFWHHQLGNDLAAPRLDGAVFAAQLPELLKADR